MQVELKKTIGLKLVGVIALATIIVCGDMAIAKTNTKTAVPNNQKASVTIRGAGVSPDSKISLSTGPKQTLVSQADKNGNFVFSNLAYSAFSPLKFSLDIPPNNTGFIKNLPVNHLQLSYDPRGAVARISGNIGKSSTLAFQLEGSDKSRMQIAGEEGSVNLQSRTAIKLASGESKVIASIVNVGDVCCPRMIVPASPITLTISSVPFSNVPRSIPPSSSPAKAQSPSIPYIQKDTPAAAPSSPLKAEPEQKPEKQEKKKIPYIVQGAVDLEINMLSDKEFSAAVSFSEADYDRTYVGGLKKITDEIRNAIVHHIAAFGAMIDGRNMMDTLRSLQNQSVETMKNYTPSESICRFGTLSRSLVKSEMVVDKNHLAFSKALLDRNNQTINGILHDPSSGIQAFIRDFKGKYCEPVDDNMFLDFRVGLLGRYCESIVATADLVYNRDVDFTRLFDVPLTLDADFTDPASQTNDQQSLLALFGNLGMVRPYIPSEGDSTNGQFNPDKNANTIQDVRAVNAARDVVSNSFGALVAEKVKSPMQSAVYIKAVLEQLGLNQEDITRLIGDNPSYFAQMEIMTKKIFQDPQFYANLYDSPANIDRQRVAMKAVELQQGRDFLESLRRREMLLSTLLSMKLRTESKSVQESSVVTQQSN